MVDGSDVRDRRTVRTWRWLAGALLLIGLIACLAPRAHAQSSDEVVWDNYDVTIDVGADGVLHVTERQEIQFNGSGYQNGFADLPLKNTNGITNVQVSELKSGRVVPFRKVSSSNRLAENTFSTSDNGSMISIDYRFSRANYEARTFLLEYDVLGGIRVYRDLDPPNQQIWWTAITGETTEAAPVRDATMTINLPEAVPLDQVQVLDTKGNVVDPKEYTSDGQTFTWRDSGLTNGDSFDVRLQFPPIIDVEAPQWQLTDDQEREAEQRRDDRQSFFNLIFIGIAGFGLVAGAVLLYAFWFTRGRDPQIGPVADFLPEPPDNLPPAIAGVLLDEKADERDVVATIVDLSRRGVFQIEESKTTSGSRMDLIAKTSTLPENGFEKALVQELFGNDFKEGAKVPVVAGSMHDPLSLRNRLYDEVVALGLFERSPEATRSSVRTTGYALLGLGLVGAIFLPGVTGFGWSFLPALVVALFGLALRFVSPYAPRKTEKGAEEAEKWRAFYRYLDDIEKYDKIQDSSGIFEKYLPYATAFGLDTSWVNKFARYNTPAPTWYGGPVIIGSDPFGRGYQPRPGNSGGASGIPGGGFNWPDSSSGGGGSRDDRGGGGGGLQGWSDSAAQNIQGASNSLSDLLNSAGRAFSSFGSSGGGGSSRSSSRGSFGSRGSGSRGFSGGGSRGGSSGGGKRGFSR